METKYSIMIIMKNYKNLKAIILEHVWKYADMGYGEKISKRLLNRRDV